MTAKRALDQAARGGAGQGRQRAAEQATAAPVGPAMRRIGRAIEQRELPAIEKLSEETAATPFRTLVSVMLSAQTRDPVTEAASRRLFAVASTPRELAALPEAEIERLIYPVSFYRNKARHVREMSRQLLSRFRGKVPRRIEDLLTLPGVGRKTATLVLIVEEASKDHICVDTHVHRISNRLGWVRTKTPAQTEQALYRATPRRWWADINLYLVTWGQWICRPVYPLCGACAVRDLCPRLGVTREGTVRA